MLNKLCNVSLAVFDLLTMQSYGKKKRHTSYVADT